MKLPTTLAPAPPAATAAGDRSSMSCSGAATFGAVLGEAMGGPRHAGRPGATGTTGAASANAVAANVAAGAIGAADPTLPTYPAYLADAAAEHEVAAEPDTAAEPDSGSDLPGTDAGSNGTAVPEAAAAHVWAALQTPPRHDPALQTTAKHSGGEAQPPETVASAVAVAGEVSAVDHGPSSPSLSEPASAPPETSPTRTQHRDVPTRTGVLADSLAGQEAGTAAAHATAPGAHIPAEPAPVQNVLPLSSAQPPAVVPSVEPRPGAAPADPGKETTQGGGAPPVEAGAASSTVSPTAFPAPALPLVPVQQQPLAAVAPPAPAIAPPLAEQLARPLFTLATATPGEHVMTISVVPDTLGPVTVRAHLSADGVRIELLAAHDTGREGLRSILGELRRDLAAGGMASSLSLGNANMSAAGGGNGNAGGGNTGHGLSGGGQGAQENGSGQRGDNSPGSWLGSGGRAEGHDGRAGPGHAPSDPTNNSLDITV